MKKIVISIVLSALLMSCFVIPSFAAGFTGYQNVSDTVTSVNILMDAYMNDEDFSYSDDYLIFSDAQNSYYLVYGEIDPTTLSGTDLNYYRYYSTTATGYGYNWLLTSGTFSDVFSFNNGDYTYVSSSGLGGLQHTSFEESYDVYILICLVVVFVVLFVFNLFRGFVGGGYN